MNQDLHFFDWNKFVFGEGKECTLAKFIFLILISETSVLLDPFNHDQKKFKTKLICLLQMDMETSRIPPPIMLPVLSFNVKFKYCYVVSHTWTELAQSIFHLGIRQCYSKLLMKV